MHVVKCAQQCAHQCILNVQHCVHITVHCIVQEASAPARVELKVALYDYTAQQDDELGFQRGDVITILSRDHADWWKGELGQGRHLSLQLCRQSAACQWMMCDRQ